MQCCTNCTEQFKGTRELQGNHPLGARQKMESRILSSKRYCPGGLITKPGASLCSFASSCRTPPLHKQMPSRQPQVAKNGHVTECCGVHAPQWPWRVNTHFPVDHT